MGDGVNTNVEALHEIKNSLVRFQERIQPLQGDLRQAFQSSHKDVVPLCILLMQMHQTIS